MTGKFKRHLKKEIASGKAKLPEDLLFLSDVDYFAIAEQRVQGARKWYVEIIGTSLKSLLEVQAKLKKSRLTNRKLKEEMQRLEDEAFSRKNQLRRFQTMNERLQHDIEVVTESVEALQEDVAIKNAEIRKLREELNSIKEEIEPLRKVNAKLMENAEQDRKKLPEQKGPKNFFVEMEERGVALNGPAIQAGDGGATKR